MIVLGAPLAFADLVTQFSFDGATITVDGTTQTVTTSGGASTAGSGITFGSGLMLISNLTVSPTGTTGGFTIETFAQSNSPAGGCCTFPTLDVNGFQSHNLSGATGTLTITTGDTGFTLPPGKFPTLTSSVEAVAANINGSNATFGFTTFLDTTNAQFGTGQSVVSGSMNLGIGLGQTIVNTAPVNPGTTPFSLTDVATITLANGDFLSGASISTTVTTVPEPSTWLLLGIALAGLAAWRSRKIAT